MPGQQQRDIQQINAETKSLLVELRTHAVDTNQIVGEQFNKLLDRFVLEAKNASGAGDPAFDLDSFRQNFLMDVAAMVDEARRASGQVGQIRSRETSEERERARRLERARRGPSERILGALMSEPMLAELSEPLVRTLSQYAFDVVISNETHIPEGLVVRPDQDGIRELTHLGLIELGDPPWPRGEEEEVWGHLTPKGRALASLITAESVPPDAEKHFPWLRLARDVLDPRRTE